MLDRLRRLVGMSTAAERQADNDLKTLMGVPWGRRFVWGLLAEAGVFRNPYTGERASTDFRCGEQNTGQKLLARVTRICKAEYLTMTIEAMNATKDETTPHG